MRELTFNEVEMVDGASAGEVAAAAAAGIGAARTVAWVAGVTMGPGAAAAVVIGGAALGVALYYLTD